MDVPPYSRNNDPESSKEADALLDLSWSRRSARKVERWLLFVSADHYGSERELGQLLSDAFKKKYPTWEEGRRQVRTLRDVHGMLEYVLDSKGDPIWHRNVTGRRGNCLQLTPQLAPVLVFDTPRRNDDDSIKKRPFIPHGPPKGLVDRAGRRRYLQG